MLAYLLSPNSYNWYIAKLKNNNLNATEVLASEFKNAFARNFQLHRRDPSKNISHSEPVSAISIPPRITFWPSSDGIMETKMSSPLYQACADQDNLVRHLKTAKASKDDITAAVAKLLKLKEEYKAATGQDYKPPAGGTAPRDTKKAAQKPKKEEKKQKVAQQPKKGESWLGVEVSKSENLAEWYQQTKADLIEYYDVSGCYVLLPGSYAIWDSIKDFFDAEIKNSASKILISQCLSHRQLLRRKKIILMISGEIFSKCQNEKFQFRWLKIEGKKSFDDFGS